MFQKIKNDLHYKMFMKGEWHEAKDFMQIKSPVTDDTIGWIPAMNKEQITEAVKTCALTQKEWANFSLFRRCEILLSGAKSLVEHKEEIALIMADEISKEYESCLSEISRTADLIRASAEAAKAMNGEVLSGGMLDDSTKGKTAIIKREPLGVILAISPFNYPINLAASKIAPALIMGNAVVFKPATQGVISALHMVRCLEHAGLPAGILAVVTGAGAVVGPHLLTHREISMINFTGSTTVGQGLSKTAGPIPLIMELGGKDPAIILDTIEIDKTIEQIVKGAFGYSGQRCTAIKRVIVPDSIADEVVEKLKAEVSKVTVGGPFDHCMVTPLISRSAAKFVLSLIEDARSKGGAVTEFGVHKGNLVYPTLVDYATKEMNIFYSEPFGPVLPIIRVSGIEQAIQTANDTEYGLQASVFGQNMKELFYAANALEAGTINLNGKSERGPDNFPFLGRKNSGIGVQGVRYALEAGTTFKSIVINL